MTMKILNIIALTVMCILSTIFRGIVITYFWLWFVVPNFSVGLLSIPAAIGLSLLVAFLTTKKGDFEESKTTVWQLLTTNLIFTAVIWGFGWFVSLFM